MSETVTTPAPVTAATVRPEAAPALEPTPGQRPETMPERLWSVKDAAIFLQKSRRWLFLALRLPENAPGSVPHVRLGRSPRFIPDDLRSWASMNFPPAATFKTWRAEENRKKRFSRT
jgi:hypothetical protein